jgi:hypothetical protein
VRNVVTDPWAARGAGNLLADRHQPTDVLATVKRWLLAMLKNRQGEVRADFLRVAPVPPRKEARRF